MKSHGRPSRWPFRARGQSSVCWQARRLTGALPDRVSSPAPFGQAGVPPSGDDDVVQDLDAAKIADLAQPLGQFDVRFRGRLIAGWVVVTVLCPGPLCGGVFQRHGYRGPGEPGRPHNDRPQSAASQDSSAGSSRQEAPFTGRLSWAIGGSVRRSAASLTRVLISAYRFVVASPA